MADQPKALVLRTPPPFMRTCGECSALLDALIEAFVNALMDAFYDGAVRVQIALARHLADVHPDALPPPHSDGCESCARFQQRDGDGVFWREHLALGLFLPDDIARLM